MSDLVGEVDERAVTCEVCGRGREERWTDSGTLLAVCGHCADHVYEIMYGDLSICGCGNPDDAFALVAAILGLAPFSEHRRWEQVQKLIGTPGAAHLILSQLEEKAELLGHGGWMGGSWLTSKGEFALRAFGSLPSGSDHGSGFPHDGGSCSVDCWVLLEQSGEGKRATPNQEAEGAPEHLADELGRAKFTGLLAHVRAEDPGDDQPDRAV